MKGSRAQLGDENISANGYCYVKTSTGWVLKHHLVAEGQLGRPLKDNERVSFRDKDRTNFAPSNIVVTTMSRTKGTSSLNKRLTTIEDKMIAYIEGSKDKEAAVKELDELTAHLIDVYLHDSRA